MTPSQTTATLCVGVQAFARKTGVLPGGHARFAIWVWFAGGRQGTATVHLTARPGKLSPVFTVCPAPGTATCTAGLATSQPVELMARVAVPRRQAAGTRIILTATATSPLALAAASASGSVIVAAKASPSPSATSTAPAGVGVTLPSVTLPSALPANSLPALPHPLPNPALAFPEISPAPSPSPSAAARPIQVTDVSAQFPLNSRLIGGQIAGLALLAVAATIAVARLSLRKRKGAGGGGSP